MGIPNFFGFVKNKTPGAIELISDLSRFRGARLGVDAPVLLFRARAANPEPLA